MWRVSLWLLGAIGIFIVLAPEADAQTRSVRVERATPVLERPRGDSFVLGSLEAGEVVQVLEQQGGWYLITPPADRVAGSTWQRGWIRAEVLNPADRPTLAPSRARAQAPARPPGRRSVRAFGQLGGVLFTARDSFEAIVDGAFGVMFGGGGQYLFPGGGFLEAGFERYQADGQRVLVSGNEYFRLPIPTTISVTPIQFTAGYRPVPRSSIAPYLGAGVGVYRYREETPGASEAEVVSRNHFSFHFTGGVEYRVAPWVSLAGEAQWSGVPKSLGEEGISLVFGEEDLGGGTFRVKIIVGR